MPYLEGKNPPQPPVDSASTAKPASAQAALILSGTAIALLLVIAGIFWKLLQDTREDLAGLRCKIDPCIDGGQADGAPQPPPDMGPSLLEPVHRLEVRTDTLTEAVKDLGVTVATHGGRLDMLEGKSEEHGKQLDAHGKQLQLDDGRIKAHAQKMADLEKLVPKDLPTRREITDIQEKQQKQDNAIKVLQRTQFNNGLRP